MPAPDITEEFGGDVGSPSSPPISVAPTAPTSLRWDCSVGGLSFLFAMSDQFPYQRETGEFRRQRVDTERNPGEQSLDSGFWIRSQSSWHYGSGLSSAEPLEVNESEAQFRYHGGGGVDPWTAGQLTLLHDTASVWSDATTNQYLLGADTGVVHAASVTATYISNAGSSATISWGGSANPITSLSSDGGNYYIANATGIYKGALPSGSGAKIWDTGASTLARFVKSRLMAGIGASLYELVTGGPTLPTPLFTHPNSGWTWTDFAEGPTAIYVSGYSGDTSMVYKIDVTSSASAVTLSQPTVVAELPRGELVKSLLSYLGAYLIIGTTKGARVALIDNSYGAGGALTMGPLMVRSSDGCLDAVADDTFVYVTVGGEGEAGNRVQRAGLFRIDLSANLNENALQFPSAADLVAPSGTSGDATQVTVAGGKLWFAVSGQGVFKEQDTYVAEGWLETGRIRLGTLEAKAWRDLRITAEPDMDGSVSAYTSLADSSAPSTWTLTTTATGTNYDMKGSLSAVAPNQQGNMYVAVRLVRDDTEETPVFTGYQLRAIPAPNRTELVSVPVMCFDVEKDRQGAQYGYAGSAWARYSVLKQLERAASTVQWLDHTTGERAEAYIERVSMRRKTPPSRGFDGAGGIVTILLRLV